MLVKAIIEFVNRKDREGLAEFLQRMTALEFIFIMSELQFALADIFTLLKDYDVVCTPEGSSDSNLRPVQHAPGGSTVCDE